LYCAEALSKRLPSRLAIRIRISSWQIGILSRGILWHSFLRLANGWVRLRGGSLDLLRRVPSWLLRNLLPRLLDLLRKWLPRLLNLLRKRLPRLPGLLSKLLSSSRVEGVTADSLVVGWRDILRWRDIWRDRRSRRGQLSRHSYRLWLRSCSDTSGRGRGQGNGLPEVAILLAHESRRLPGSGNVSEICPFPRLHSAAALDAKEQSPGRHVLEIRGRRSTGCIRTP
jgi:hypothetical protein